MPRYLKELQDKIAYHMAKNVDGMAISLTRLGSTTARTVYGQVQPMQLDDLTRFAQEAGINAADANGVRLVLGGVQDVREGDTITWDGSFYRVTSIQGITPGGVKVAQQAVAFRSGKAT